MTENTSTEIKPEERIQVVFDLQKERLSIPDSGKEVELTGVISARVGQVLARYGGRGHNFLEINYDCERVHKEILHEYTSKIETLLEEISIACEARIDMSIPERTAISKNPRSILKYNCNKYAIIIKD